MWENINEIKLRELNPILADRVRRFLASMKTQGVDILIAQGLRTWAQQDSLYQQGRGGPGKIVTNAKAGYSWHNFGLAVDVVPGKQGIVSMEPDWNESHPVWKRMLEEAKKFDLAEGAEWRSFPDYPHLYPVELPSTPPESVRWVFQQNSVSPLSAIWAHVKLV